MGFGLPSALGAAAALAEPARDTKVVVDIDGDGSFLMNVQVGSLSPLVILSLVPLNLVSCLAGRFSVTAGDGGALWTPDLKVGRDALQELATVAIDKLPTKMFILNNQHLGMVVQWEDRFYKANRAHTYLGRRVRLWTRLTLPAPCHCRLRLRQLCERATVDRLLCERA